MRCLRYVTVLHVLGRGFCLFGPICCLDFFLGKDGWLACRFAGFWKYKVGNRVLVAYQQGLGA
jgi:hypothetical protein